MRTDPQVTPLTHSPPWRTADASGWITVQGTMHERSFQLKSLRISIEPLCRVGGDNCWLSIFACRGANEAYSLLAVRWDGWVGSTFSTSQRFASWVEKSRHIEVAQSLRDCAIRGANDHGRIAPSYERNKRRRGRAASFLHFVSIRANLIYAGASFPSVQDCTLLTCFAARNVHNYALSPRGRAREPFPTPFGFLHRCEMN
jgi:hypothetical protein